MARNNYCSELWRWVRAASFVGAAGGLGYIALLSVGSDQEFCFATNGAHADNRKGYGGIDTHNTYRYPWGNSARIVDFNAVEGDFGAFGNTCPSIIESTWGGENYCPTPIDGDALNTTAYCGGAITYTHHGAGDQCINDFIKANCKQLVKTDNSPPQGWDIAWLVVFPGSVVVVAHWAYENAYRGKRKETNADALLLRDTANKEDPSDYGSTGIESNKNRSTSSNWFAFWDHFEGHKNTAVPQVELKELSPTIAKTVV
jgi:hypothetical protein